MLDIVFYKVLIALEMLLPVGLYASVGVTLGQMYTDSEITAISAAGAVRDVCTKPSFIWRYR